MKIYLFLHSRVEKRRSQAGFTLIELMLAMAFIAFIILSIAAVAIQATRSYNRGVVLQSLNQSGRNISDTLRRDFLQTDQRRVSVSIDNPGQAVIENESSGRFCLGDYSYLWNTAKALDDVSSASAVIRDHEGLPINLVRVVDENSELCQDDGAGQYTLDDASRVTHVLKRPSDDSEVVLSVYSFSVTPMDGDSDYAEGLYRVEYMIGTSDQSEINTADNQCKPPTDGGSNMEFCAINKFETIVRTNG